MKLLLDTHALLWWMSDDDRLAQRARGLIADPANNVLVSVASLWEIVIKVRVGKLMAEIDEIGVACEQGGFILLNVAPGHLRVLSNLARHHRDPFDHLLIAQAITEKATFVSADQNTSRYPVSTIGCSDP